MASERQKLEEAALPLMLDAMWAANVMDIQQTLRAVCLEVRTSPVFLASAFSEHSCETLASHLSSKVVLLKFFC